KKPKPRKDSGTDSNSGNSGSGAGTATAKPKAKKSPQTKQPPSTPLPPWKVLLHNDDKNDMFYVINTVVELTPLNEQAAKVRTLEAHETGVALLLVTH